METYCVKDRRKTPNVSGSDTVVTTKNGRKILKAKCAVCGITKTRDLPRGKTTGMWVPWSFGVPNFTPKMLKAFQKSVRNHEGIAKKTLKNFYGTGSKK